jgi:hypothetical protein
MIRPLMVDDQANLLLFFFMNNSSSNTADPATVGEDIEVPERVV